MFTKMVASVIFMVLVLSRWVIALSSSPHLIFIVADDLGWNDVGYHNPDIISPTIDNLAGSGIRLNQSYVQPLCSPSRSAFMTGVYPFRMGLQHLVIGEKQDVCVPLNRKFFPQLLKENGYKTHMIGKWHLGFCKWECTPTYRGFDSFFGFYSGGEDYYTHIYPGGYDLRDNKTVSKVSASKYSTYEFAERAEKIIRDHDETKPLYLYMPFQSVHMPLQVPEKYLDMYPNITNKNRKALSAMVTSLDDAIARILNALQEKGLYKDSIIVFTADNGGWTTYGGNNYPLRGGKISIFEGGTRVPAFVHSPLLKKTGATFDGMMHAVDWFPTLQCALGISNNDSLDQDGVNQWQAITSLGPSKRSEIVYNMDYHPTPLEGQSAIRFGDYKLIEGYPGIYQGWYKPDGIDQGPAITAGQLIHTTSSSVNVQAFSLPRQNWNGTHLGYKYLFNLKDDPEERHNLYDQLPDVVQRLKTRLVQARKRYVTPNYPNDSPGADPKHYDGVWSPGWC